MLIYSIRTYSYTLHLQLHQLLREAPAAPPVWRKGGLISPYSGRDCVKSLRSSYTGLYSQKQEHCHRGSTLPPQRTRFVSEPTAVQDIYLDTQGLRGEGGSFGHLQ